MPKFSRDFGSPAAIERQVEFKVYGQRFECVGDITAGDMEDYLACIRLTTATDDDGEPYMYVPMPDQLRFIDACLVDDETRERWRALRHDKSKAVSTDTVNGIKDYLIETYSERNPTDELPDSSDGSSANGTTSAESVGPQA